MENYIQPQIDIIRIQSQSFLSSSIEGASISIGEFEEGENYDFD